MVKIAILLLPLQGQFSNVSKLFLYLNIDLFFSNTEMTANSSDEIVISDEEDHGDEVLVVNESCETGVDLESPNKISEPLNNQDRNNDSGSGNSDIIIMEEDMAVDLSITSKNSKEGEGKYIFAFDYVKFKHVVTQKSES